MARRSFFYSRRLWFGLIDNIGNEFNENKIPVPIEIHLHQRKPTLAEQMVNTQPTHLIKPARSVRGEVSC